MTPTPEQARAELARRELARRGVSMDQPQTDWKGVVGGAVKDSFRKPAAFAKDLGTNPESMANAMPAVLGAGMGVAMPWGGGTAGTAAGQGIRDLALGALKKPIPTLGQHGLELGLAALGDAIAIPSLKRAHYGAEIGKAESKFPGMSEVVKEAPPSGARTAVKLSQQLKGKDLSPLEAKRFQPAMNTVYEKKWPFQKPYKMYSPDFREASVAVQKGLNKVPGRGPAAQGMAQAMTIPNALRDAKDTIWQNPVIRRLIYAALTGLGIGEGAKLTGLGR